MTHSETYQLLTQGVGPCNDNTIDPKQDKRYDPELLRLGDNRNVIDRYRYWNVDAIVADLDKRRHPFCVAIENWQHDLNIGSIVRSANAFAANLVHIIGRRRWNKRGAMVTDRYQHVLHHETIDSFAVWAKKNQLPVIAVDNVKGCQPIHNFCLPRCCVLLFGQEGPGLSQEAINMADAIVAIEQFGSTRSINASAAAAIAMHSWITRHADYKNSV